MIVILCASFLGHSLVFISSLCNEICLQYMYNRWTNIDEHALEITAMVRVVGVKSVC